MSNEANKQLVVAFMEAFSRGQTDKMLGMLTDSATWWVAGNFPLSGTWNKRAFADLLGGVAGSCKGPIRLTPKAFTAEGDRVAVETESYAELKNGRVYKNQYHFLFEIRDGKIERVREYLDTMHANEIFCTP